MAKKKNKRNKRSVVVNDQPIATTDIKNVQETTAETIAAPVDELEELNHEYAYVKKDVRKLMIVIAILAVLMVLTYFLETKSSVLTTVGDWIYSISHISL